MNQIWFKQVIVIDGQEHIISQSDYSQHIHELKQNGMIESIADILVSITEDENVYLDLDKHPELQ